MNDADETRPRPLLRSPEVDRVGAMLGRYRLVAPLGAGGMATVFAAEHVDLQKRVAIKVLRHELAADEQLRRRFVQEGIAASRVRHPHVVDVSDVCEEDGQAFLVMELLEGESLAALLDRDGVVELGRALDYLLPVALALGAAHRVGIVHRDVKPDNVLLARERSSARITPKLLDFGIAQVATIGARRITDGMNIVGTPHYMAPEQARGEDQDGRADQYALAVTLYETVTGALPYELEGLSAIDIVLEVGRGETIPITRRWLTAPEGLEDVVSRALSPLPDDRFPTIEAFGAALLPYATSRGLRAFREQSDARWGTPSLASTSVVSGPVVRAPTRAPDATSSTRPPGTPQVASPTPSSPVLRSQPERARPLVAFVAAIGLVVIAVLGAIVAHPPTEEPSAEVAVSAAAEDAAIAVPVTPASADVTITTDPAWAVVLVDGRPAGVGTATVPAPRAGEELHLVVRADGYVQWESYVASSFARHVVLVPQ